MCVSPLSVRLPPRLPICLVQVSHLAFIAHSRRNFLCAPSLRPPSFASSFLTRTPTGELLQAHGMEESTAFQKATEPPLSSAHFTLDSFCILSYTNLFGAPSASTSDSDQRRQRERATSAVRFDDWIKQATVDDDHSRKGTDDGRVPRAQSGRGGGWISTLWRVSKPFHLTTDRRRDRPNERIDRCPLSVHSDVLPRAPRRKSGQRSTGRRATAERGLSSGNYNAAEEEEE